MTEEESSEHGEVVSSLMDLQRRLRGDAGPAEPPAHAPPPAHTPPPAHAPRAVAPVRAASPPIEGSASSETLEVVEPDLTVRMAPTDASRAVEPPAPRPDAEERFAPVTQLPTTTAGEDRLTGLAQRLGRLENDLSGVLGSVESMRSDVTTSVNSHVTERMTAAQRDDDARIARIVAERLDAVSKRLSAEVVLQRRQLAALLEQRIEGVEETLREAIREASQVDLRGDEPRS